ncbi:MAG: hypothetical protein ABIJ00_11125 [Candidatus Eisenbacteria bacterium]
MRKRWLALPVAVLLVFVSFTGCSMEDTGGSPGVPTPPELPSISTMTMNTSLFQSSEVDTETLALSGYGQAGAMLGLGSKLNFFNAATRVLFLDLVILVGAVQPVAAFALAGQSIPQPQGDGSWLWTYIFVDQEGEHSIFLYGKNMGTYTEWRMEVSSTEAPAPTDHFLWFEGEVQQDQCSGYWQFYRPVEELAAGATDMLASPGIQCIRIDWEHREGDEQELAFLLNEPGAPWEGSTLIFSETPAVSSVDFFDSSISDGGVITWYPDCSGSIEWFDYRDGEKQCWDSLHDDTVCPE